MENEMYDYIIVGAGSAGCILAYRLSENPSIKVLLLEAGPRDRDPWLHIPAGVSQVRWKNDLTWQLRTVPQTNLADRPIDMFYGRVFGGTSSINGMAYNRGQAEDYNHWASLGNKGWSWEDVLPFFEKSLVRDTSCQGLRISTSKEQSQASRTFLQAACGAGLAVREDFNAGKNEGVGFVAHTIEHGRRSSAASAFLAPARKRGNLRVESHAYVTRILLEGCVAHGVEVEQHDRRIRYHGREIVLSAGVIMSPAILLRSGIGPSDQLKALGIDVIQHNSAVGENLHDHASVALVHETKPGFSDNDRLKFPRVIVEVTRYLTRRSGLLARGASPIYGYFRSDPTQDRPDMQLNFRPFAVLMANGRTSPLPFPSISSGVMNLAPQSRGWIRLADSNARSNPLVNPAYLSIEPDRQKMLAGLKFLRSIFASPLLTSLLSKESRPGADCVTDSDLTAYIRDHANWGGHLVGSCSMGTVVDERLKVRGIMGLRVADASVMPTVTRGNTNAPTMMIAERAAAFIHEDQHYSHSSMRQPPHEDFSAGLQRSNERMPDGLPPEATNYLI